MNTDRLLLKDLKRLVAAEDNLSILIAREARDEIDFFSGDVQPVYDSMLETAQAVGCPVTLADSLPLHAPKTARGWFSLSPRMKPEIGVLVRGRSLGAQAKSLLHEEGHLFTPGIIRYDINESEVIAESAAYIVGRQLGFNLDEYSPGYVANWTMDRNFDIHPERVSALEMPILTTARRLGDAIDRQHSFRRAA